MRIRRFTILMMTAGLILVLFAGPAAASEQTQVMTIVRQFVDAFNKGDMRAAVALCASPSSVIDDFSPHEWQGPSACADWASAYQANAKENKITDDIVTLLTPWHLDVTGDRAYVVVPVNNTYKMNGKAVMESGAVFTVALKKNAAGWRITGWAWAGH